MWVITEHNLPNRDRFARAALPRYRRNRVETGARQASGSAAPPTGTVLAAFLSVAPGSYQLELLSPNDGAHTVHTVEILLGQVTPLDAAAPLGNDS